ncbi:DUF2975 domain-containing protein [Flavobacterium arcticum]|uniref:DUF2975 domain-containing protein n=1 Tax=Flavobacterium arcticum TaxID=1784713 RepID=A0A345HB44_9FLAO|nr:DUF2975 domain-containing protein [Flavobacterium arcticum]AXG73804.1 DUF2975 domain-containing protein [Flavobacterium arcticum]KAF2511755.1 DUF2975 domain-containing protein [Flavobacterium arcticum]
MRKLSTLKTIADILFVLTMIGAVIGLPFILMLAVMPEQVPFTLNENLESIGGWELIIILLIVYLGALFFVYALYLFRKTLDLFRKRIIFDNRVIKNFDQIGKAILIGYFIIFTMYVFTWFTDNTHEIKFNIGWNNTLFTIGLGLFFIVLSEVFQMGKNLKEENEQTI